jgi:signal peptidase II
VRNRRGLRWLSIFVLFACVGCDQASKRIVTDRLADGRGISTLGGMLLIDRVENPGGFLGLGANLPAAVRAWVYGLGVGAGLTLLAGLLLRRDPAVASRAVAIGLVLGGGFGNWLDRISSASGTVVDFLQIRLGPVHTGVFNFADVAILTGGILLVVLRLRPAAS